MQLDSTIRMAKALAAMTACAALMTACGGGSGGQDSSDTATPAPAPSPGPDPAPAPAPSPAPAPAPAPIAVDRIEPFDSDASATKSVAAPRVIRAVTGPGERVTLAPIESGALSNPADDWTKSERQIGVARTVAALQQADQLASLLRWVDTPIGTRAAAVTVVSEGAQGVRLGVLVRALPSGATLRFYGRADGEVVEMTAQRLLELAARHRTAGLSEMEAHMYWAPDFGGESVTLEVEIPASAPVASVQLAVPQLSHFVMAPEAVPAPGFAKVGESGACEVDVVCKPEFLEQGRSVVRMLYVRDGNSFLCSGTLLNDMASSGTPYLLSANHCVSRQAEASTLNTWWFYRSSACNSGSLQSFTQRRTGGAVLLHSTAATDTSFMRLNDAPPPGVVYAGSYFGALNTGVPIVGVHHPRGDLQKVSQGQLQRFSVCANDACSTSDAAQGTYLTVAWQQGVTESGSSGSALFHTLGSRRYVIGQLYGGASSCAAPTGLDHYGRFDVAYRNALKQWLNP